MNTQTGDNASPAQLDWRDLVPPQERHECDCSYCDMGGDLEPVQWPLLVTMTVGEATYVSDRYMMIRADLAPIPEDYQGTTMATEMPSTGLLAAAVTDEPVRGQHFRWQAANALEATGWRLRVLENYDTGGRTHPRRGVGIIDHAGVHIGYVIPARTPDDDAWSVTFSREYVEPPPAQAEDQCDLLPNDGDETCMTHGVGRDRACDTCRVHYPAPRRSDYISEDHR